MERDKISVVIPVYNVAPYMSDCIDSVLCSTYRDLEVILVDDGSSDGSGDICDRYARKDGRVKVTHKENGGASSARNAGLKAATGKYVGFVDSDDVVSPDMYETLYNDIRKNQAQIAVCGHKTVYKDYTVQDTGKNEFYVWDSVEAIKKLIVDKIIGSSVCNKLYLRELFSGISFDEGISYGEDRLVNYYLIKSADKIVLNSKCLYTYRKRSGSTTTKPFSVKQLSRIDAAKRMKADIDKSLPQLRDYGVSCLVKAMLSTYGQSLSCPEFEQERSKMLAELREIWKSDRQAIFPKLKMALILLLINPALYAAGLKAYKWVRKCKARLKNTDDV